MSFEDGNDKTDDFFNVLSVVEDLIESVGLSCVTQHYNFSRVASQNSTIYIVKNFIWWKRIFY